MNFINLDFYPCPFMVWTFFNVTFLFVCKFHGNLSNSFATQTTMLFSKSTRPHYQFPNNRIIRHLRKQVNTETKNGRISTYNTEIIIVTVSKSHILNPTWFNANSRNTNKMLMLSKHISFLTQYLNPLLVRIDKSFLKTGKVLTSISFLTQDSDAVCFIIPFT